MATTALTSVNNVLRLLRENPVNAVTFSTNTYAQLILQFLNQTKQECENAWDWTLLRRSITITTSIGVNSYSITGAGNRFRFYDPRKIIINATTRQLLNQANSGWLEEAKNTFAVANQAPNFFRFYGQDANNDPILELYPVPNMAYSLVVPLVVPDTDLVLATDTYRMQQVMVEMGMWARAISERGEDGGQNTSEQWQIYRSYMADNIAQDAGLVPDETVWQSV